MRSTTQKIIIDTDPGQDDGVAILLALASPELEVIGITTVAGNVPLALTSRNARIVCELAKRSDIKVFAGCDRPLKKPLVTAENVHGKTGLDGIDLPEPTMPLQAQHSVDFIIETFRNAPEKTITLCTLGPMTNIAQALMKAPDIATRIQKIISMGGGFFEGGNITPSAEFNMFVDPDAAKVVFDAGIEITVVPLDVTHKALTSATWIKELRALNTLVGEAVASWTDFFERYDKEKYGSAGAPLHDPCVIGYLVAPHLFTGKQINVEIETTSELTMGATVADWWKVTDRPKNAYFLNTIDRDGFFDLLTERLSSYSA
ncbi:nucleoside hydrolase [Acinetobacter nectaris]|uniref:nucleoside hydrolase n=1 Tax=Acinetobacter nectaris TaxID=1219382 RepID=UPI001F3E4967|nr:nucleoside hydrolase [Acinetobacter nectaris]MCF9045921.1 nucleoside hydrolase [Acinetobacter nectaris]